MRWTFRPRARTESDFAAEVESHVAMEADRLVERGMSRDDALSAARRAFGNRTIARERFHESRRGRSTERLVEDMRYALRGVRRHPGFAAVVVLSLALGIGANTTMFSTIDTLLFRAPAHVRDADRIHRVYAELPGPDGQLQPWPALSFRLYAALRDRVRGFDAISAFWRTTVSSGHGADARRFDAVLTTASFFPLLGVRPALGRFPASDEERDTGEHVAVLGYDTWRGRFAGDSTVLGHSIDVNGTSHVIIGVAPRGFTGIDLERVDLWLPIGAATRLLAPNVIGENAGGYWLQIIARGRPGVTDDQLTSETAVAYRELQRDASPGSSTSTPSVRLGPIIAARGPAAGADAKVSVWVSAMSVLVLLIACANVANLLLLRGLVRGREAAVRLSLGASRWRLARQSLTEGAILAIAGGACALVVARWSAAAVRAFLIPNAPEAPSLFDPRLLAFTLAVTLGTGVLAALAPALVNARGSFGALLRSGRAGDATRRLLAQRRLVTAQVTLAMVLLVGATLFVGSLRNVRAIDLGIDVDRLLYVNVDLGDVDSKDAAPGTPEARRPFEMMLQRVRALPGVEHATLTAGEPLASSWALSVRRPEMPPPPENSPAPFARAVAAEYFETMGTPLVRGRLFRPADHAPNAHVAILDEATARAYWPRGDAIGSCALLGSDSLCTQIVGVVANTVQWEITGRRGQVIYVPIEAWPDQRVSMLQVRTARDPQSMVAVVRQTVSALSPDMPWVNVQPVSELLAPQLRPWRLGASMFTAFGALALGLAAIGLYGLVSYAVAQRAHEIGIRKALGASEGGMVRMVLGRALRMTGLGIAVGGVVAFASGHLIEPQLYGVSPRDPVVYAACAGVLALVAIAASVAPARRATRVDAMSTLKAE